MVAGNKLSPLEQAIADTYFAVKETYSLGTENYLGSFLGKLLTHDYASAKLVWKCNLKSRLECLCVDQATIDIIENHLISKCDCDGLEAPYREFLG